MLLLPVLLLCACQSSVQQIQPVAEIVPTKTGELSVKAFAALPLIEKASLSPDGKFVAFLYNSNGKTSLVTQDRGGKDVHIVMSSNNEKSRFRSYAWVNNERLLIGIGYSEQFRDLKVLETRLVAVNRDGSQLKDDLVKINTDSSFMSRDNIAQYQDNFTLIANDSQHVLLSLDKRIRFAPDVYKLDVYSGETQMVASNPSYVRSWLADREGNIRVGIGIIGTKYRIVYRLKPDDDWETFAEYEALKGGSIPLGFGENPNELFILADYQGKSAVFKANLTTPTATPERVYADPNYDVKGKLIYSADQKRVIGIHYLAESDKVVYWDSEAQQLQQRIDKALSNRTNSIISNRNKQAIVFSSSASFAPVYYWLDENQNHLDEMIKAYPDLEPSLLAKPETVHFKTRDGLVLEGYLTKPIKPFATPAPTIIFPHGGPWSRDANGFNIWTQFLANRGWTVLQLNFRGSAGFGDAFVKAGFQRWGLEMQDNITDGVHWLVQEKIADPAKICIVGASYGGYAALMGLAKTPELYRCGVSFAPVTDLIQLVDEWSDSRVVDSALHTELAEAKIGSWWSDRSRLKETSPINLADKFHTPLLLAHGAEDRNVNVEHSRKMASELQSVGLKDFQYLELKQADHQLSREPDRLQFFQTMDAFLRKYQ
jgi:dipeptidyl aminopeptidase/acylaminoacyl peptidase